MSLLPVKIIKYDPVKREIVKPKLSRFFSAEYLLGYKGANFLETGMVINSHLLSDFLASTSSNNPQKG